MKVVSVAWMILIEARLRTPILMNKVFLKLKKKCIPPLLMVSNLKARLGQIHSNFLTKDQRPYSSY